VVTDQSFILKLPSASHKVRPHASGRVPFASFAPSPAARAAVAHRQSARMGLKVTSPVPRHQAVVQDFAVRADDRWEPVPTSRNRGMVSLGCNEDRSCCAYPGQNRHRIEKRTSLPAFAAQADQRRQLAALATAPLQRPSGPGSIIQNNPAPVQPLTTCIRFVQSDWSRGHLMPTPIEDDSIRAATRDRCRRDRHPGPRRAAGHAEPAMSAPDAHSSSTGVTP
jgi:hypothetical protein